MASSRETGAPVAGVILAAGLARRMGGSKVLLPWQGRPLVRHVAEVALASQLDEILVVTGHRAHDVGAVLRDLPLRVIHNPDYQGGLSTSLRAGIAALGEDVAGALIMLADQPLLTSTAIDSLLQAYWRTAAPIVAPFAHGRRGNPVLFARALFPDLLEVAGDEGARAVIEAYRDRMEGVEVDEAVFQDVDTPEVYAALSDRPADS
ncbi:MAG: nucleotidyltransferase family protein [Chloroflexota bacterium]|nr:nucleotidyltransferase family protein [Chloroflexota bacterium]